MATAINTEKSNRPAMFLKSQVHMVLHTQNAASLFRGNWKENRMGLTRFAMIVAKMFAACKEDDPYAERQLFKIFDAIQKLSKEFAEYEKQLAEKMANFRGMEIDLLINENPLKCPLNFTNPFAFMAARLLENLDYLSRQLFTLYQLGVVLEERTTPNHLMAKLQRIFNLALGWKYTGITREDVRNNTPKAQEVKKLLGRLPEAILNQKAQLQFVPRKK